MQMISFFQFFFHLTLFSFTGDATTYKNERIEILMLILNLADPCMQRERGGEVKVEKEEEFQKENCVYIEKPNDNYTR